MPRTVACATLLWCSTAIDRQMRDAPAPAPVADVSSPCRIHIGPLPPRLFPDDDLTDLAAGAQTVSRDESRQLAPVGRRIRTIRNPCVGDMIDKTGVMMGRNIVIPPPDGKAALIGGHSMEYVRGQRTRHDVPNI